MNLTLIGTLMIITFMAAVLSKKISPACALVVIPVAFGLIAGFGLETFDFALAGMKSISSTFIMLTFAILFFGIMMLVGLFDPLSNIVVKFMKGDPLRVLVGTTILSAIISCDGDATTTIMICCAALLPVYMKLGISRVWLAVFIILPNGVANLLPWGGPTARLAPVLGLEPGAMLRSLLPIMAVRLAYAFVLAYIVGMKERKRLGKVKDMTIIETAAERDEETAHWRRPKQIWFNLILTLTSVSLLIADVAPGGVIFAIATFLALTVNFRDLKEQRKVIEHNAPEILNVVIMVLGAGVLMGILSESGIAEAISASLVSVLPESWGPFFGAVIALIGGPAAWILSNDAFFFGLMPVLSETAYTFGFTATQVGIAALVGQAVRGSSPIIPALYFLAEYCGVDFGEYQRKILPITIGGFVLSFALALAMGALTV